MTKITDETYPYSYQPIERAVGEGVSSITYPTMQEVRIHVAPFRFGLAAKEIVKYLGIMGGIKY